MDRTKVSGPFDVGSIPAGAASPGLTLPGGAFDFPTKNQKKSLQKGRYRACLRASMSFAELGICPEILEAIEVLGFETPSPMYR